jgi:HSP20 family protein
LARQHHDFFEFPFFGFWSPFLEEQKGKSHSGGLDLYESKGSLIIEAAVPGAKKEEISIEIKDQILRIDAEHQESHQETKEKEAIYRSQKQSSFHYATALPKEVEEGKARAKLEDGILKITIPLSKKDKKGKGITIEEGEQKS